MLERKQTSSGVTMKDVAEKAGVSTATVSRTLMNPEKVSASTRDKVEQALIAVGYTPQLLSRSAKHNDTHIILVVVPNICDSFFSEIIRGIEITAAHNGYLVIVGDCAHQNQWDKLLINLLVTRQIDGMVLLGSRLPFDVRFDEQRYLLPIVMANEFNPELKLPTAHIDNLTAAFEAVSHLLKLGHRHIACITGPKETGLTQYRLQGYIQALRRNGIAIETQWIIQGNCTFEAGKKALHTLVSQPNPPGAIFCHNDIMALGVIAQAKLMNLRIPEDISVVGFDDIEIAQCSDPPLTTISQPRFEIGCETMRLLLEQMKGKKISNESRLLDFTLKIRHSTAVARR